MAAMRANVLPIVAAAMCGAALPACGSGDSVDDGPLQRCVDETNRYRAMEGRPPVARSAELDVYAGDGAEYDHTRNPHDHFRSDSGGGIAWAENECPHWGLGFGGGTVEGLVDACVQAFYDEGPGGGHYENMMGDYATLGCGVYVDGDYTIVQDYGH